LDSQSGRTIAWGNYHGLLPMKQAGFAKEVGSLFVDFKDFIF